MAPKSDKHDPSNETEENPNVADLQEIASVNNNLDELSNVLDQMENNTENILAQLRDLLQSNREMRNEFKNLDGTTSAQTQPAKEECSEHMENSNVNKEEKKENQDEEMKEC